MAKRIGLDLGTHSIKVVHVNVKGRGPDYDVELFDEEPVPAATLVDGEVVPLEERQRVALQALADRGAFVGEQIITALPGDAATVRKLAFPFEDRRKIEAVLPGVLDDEIPLDIDDVVVSFTTLGKNADGETEVLVAFARQDAVQAQLDLLADIGVQPRHIRFDALALTELFEQFYKDDFVQRLQQGPASTPGGTVIEQGEGGPRPAVALVDIGDKRTSVCIVTEDGVHDAHTLLHGGSDATRGLARGLGLQLEEAERGKRKEAFIEVLGASAQFPEQRDISDLLKTAYAPIVRRLRQIFQGAMSSSKIRVNEVLLTGGGCQVHNLDKHFSEALNVKTRRAEEAVKPLAHALPLAQGGGPRAFHTSMALTLALSGLSSTDASDIDFRTGPFAFKGELDFLRERVTAIAAWAAVFLLSLGSVGAAQAYSLGARLDDVNERQKTVCKEITGQDIDSADRCLAIMQEGLTGVDADIVPDRSAVDTYLEVSRRFPAKEVFERKVTKMDVQDDRVTLKGKTTGHDAVEKIAKALEDGTCIAKVDRGNSKGLKDGSVEFNLTLKLDCEGHPGTELKDPPRKGPRARRPKPTTTSTAPGVVSTESKGDKAADAPLSADERKAKRREELKRRREEALERRKARAAERREGMVGRPVEGDDAAAKAKARRDKVKRIREQRSKFRNLRREQGAPKIPGITKPNGLLKKGGIQ